MTSDSTWLPWLRAPRDPELHDPHDPCFRTAMLQKQQAEMEKELEALQKAAAAGDGPPTVEICPPSPKSAGDDK